MLVIDFKMHILVHHLRRVLSLGVAEFEHERKIREHILVSGVSIAEFTNDPFLNF